MKILITNDDGVHAQGIIQLAKKVRQVAEIFVVAPSIEQSGVSQAITFLRPLFPTALGGERDTQDDHIAGYSLNGTPADCTRLGINELCPWKPDLVLSGINHGLNAGINICYSGTVGGALSASVFEVPAVAISLESNSHDFAKAASIAWPIIEEYLPFIQKSKRVLNLNIPTGAMDGNAEVVVVPVETNPLGYQFEKGSDPKGREFFWSSTKPDPEPSSFLTDTQALKQGKITLSPISSDLNCAQTLKTIRQESEMGNSVL